MTQAQQDHTWLQTIIDSCTNDFHFDAVDKLIELYKEKHNDIGLYDCLVAQRHHHWHLVKEF